MSRLRQLLALSARAYQAWKIVHKFANLRLRSFRKSGEIVHAFESCQSGFSQSTKSSHVSYIFRFLPNFANSHNTALIFTALHISLSCRPCHQSNRYNSNIEHLLSISRVSFGFPGSRNATYQHSVQTMSKFLDLERRQKKKKSAQ